MISAIEASDIIFLSTMVQPCNNVVQLIQTCMYRDPVCTTCAAPVSGLGKHNKRGLSLPSCSDPLAMMDAAVEAARPEDNDASVGASNCVPVRNLRGYKAGDGR